MSDDFGAFLPVDHHELVAGLHGTPDTSLIATKYSVAFVVHTLQRRNCGRKVRKREARAEKQLFCSSARQRRALH